MTAVLFNILFTFIPLLFFKNTSELFEFNKIVFLYGITTLIVTSWIYQSIIQRKFIFRRTILDWPLIIYLSIYLISTLFSIDPRTSVLGYYSRFNGGLISQICYVLLYWAFVSNLTAKQSLISIRYSLISTAIASAIAVFEHFGFFVTCGLMKLGWMESCWVQDVQTRVFSTLGQPNWLAALLVALIPISWAFALKASSVKRTAYSLLSALFFVTLLFTGSRSGLLAFGIESVIFLGFIFYKTKFKFVKEFTVLLLVSGLLSFVIFFKPMANDQRPTTVQGPSLETGGTESGTIRKYVWTGAVNVFKNHPILGTGPETFAYTFPMYKPIEHNLTSEWDFLYNKAHNEFLNYLANTGILGLLSYLILIGASILQIITNKYKYPINTNIQLRQNDKLGIGDHLYLFDIGLFAGYISILITNFFGFSVVPVSLLFFLFPAIVIVQSTQYEVLSKPKAKLGSVQVVLVVLILCTMYSALSTIYHYWRADIQYNFARQYFVGGNLKNAKVEIEKALKLNPKEPLYISVLATAIKSPALALKSLGLNKYDPNIRRSSLSTFANLKLPELVEKTVIDGINLSPYDPKGYMQLARLYSESDFEKSEKLFLKSIELKENYKDARFFLGELYLNQKKYNLAKEQFAYILESIDPKDELTKKYLDEI